jgi:predicted GNAT family N-acyltransferase
VTPAIVFRVVASDADRLAAYCVRSIVFIGEQACPFQDEFDGYDRDAVHIVGWDGDEPVAVARWREAGGRIKLERIAVRAAWRGRGFGHALVDFMLATARAGGGRRFTMHAQAHLQDFYARHGFVRRGEPFDEVGIAHVEMVCDDA